MSDDPRLDLVRIRQTSSVFRDVFALQYVEAHRLLAEENQRLKATVRQLQLKLLWRDRNDHRLRSFLAAKFSRGYVRKIYLCYCRDCQELHKSIPTMSVAPANGCRVFAIFQRLAEEHGITIAFHSPTDRTEDGMTTSHGNANFDRVSNKAAHVVFLERHNWLHMCYGRLLWEADRVDDPEVRRFVSFWDALEAFREF